jgi:hypothetical protein
MKTKKATPELGFNVILIAAGVIVLGCLIAGIIQTPNGAWNGERLAATFALRHGYPLYYGQNNDGPLLSWSYGPVGALAYLPATLTTSANLALRLGALLSVLFFMLPAAIVLRMAAPFRFALAGLIGFAGLNFVCDGLNQTIGIVHVDAPALGFGAMACACLLYQRGSSTKRWIAAALFAALALWSKQSVLPLIVPLAGYLWATSGWRAATLFFAATVFFVSLLGVVFAAWLGTDGLIYLNFTAVAHCPWISSLSYPSAPYIKGFEPMLRLRVLMGAGMELFHDAFPLFPILIASVFAQWDWERAVFANVKELFSRRHWPLFLLCALFLVPPSLVGRVKVGGSKNTESPALYFLCLACALAVVETIVSANSKASIRFFRAAKGGIAAFLLLIIISLPFTLFSEITEALKSSDNPQARATQFARLHPDETYFPDFPLANLLSTGHLYHSIWGVSDRILYGNALTKEQFRAQLPPNLQWVALYQPLAPIFKSWLSDFSERVEVSELPGWYVYTRPKGS